MSCGFVACHKAFRPSRGWNGNYGYIRCTSVMYCINTVFLLAVFSSLIAMASNESTSTSSASSNRYSYPT
ncbi:hypothetical protein C0J52_09734 [Blattella germanica]|nr:hypothetical protein C0J52_09734 [Blattella germanica]